LAIVFIYLAISVAMQEPTPGGPVPAQTPSVTPLVVKDLVIAWSCSLLGTLSGWMGVRSSGGGGLRAARVIAWMNGAVCLLPVVAFVLWLFWDNHNFGVSGSGGWRRSQDRSEEEAEKEAPD
jgi:hypothetical protein